MSGPPSGYVARGPVQTWSQRNGRHVSFAQADGALQNPAYRPADILKRFRAKWFSGSREENVSYQEVTRGSVLMHRAPHHFGSLSDDLLQDRHQRLRRRDIRCMARVEFESAPAILALGALRKLPEHVARRNARAIDVAARHHRLAMFELQLRLETFDRHVDPARVEPVEIGLRRVRRRRVWEGAGSGRRGSR